jgi:hypothetical protein
MNKNADMKINNLNGDLIYEMANFNSKMEFEKWLWENGFSISKAMSRNDCDRLEKMLNVRGKEMAKQSWDKIQDSCRRIRGKRG